MNNETFLSRIDGTIKNRGDIKTLNEMPENNPQIEAFALMAECFRMNSVIQDERPVIYLYQLWKYPKETIDAIFEHFGNSFDETNHFLNRLNGCDSLEEAWESYANENDVKDEFPFYKLKIS